MTAENRVSRRTRLHRLERVFVHSPIYFVTGCTTNRSEILAKGSIHEAFRKFSELGPTHGTWVGAYVVMPDHFHLFVRVDADIINLAKWLKSLKNTLSKVLRSEGIATPHWQKTFFDHVLRSGESYTQKWNYVRDNPVRAVLVAKWEDWPFAGEIFPVHG